MTLWWGQQGLEVLGGPRGKEGGGSLQLSRLGSPAHQKNTAIRPFDPGFWTLAEG